MATRKHPSNAPIAVSRALSDTVSQMRFPPPIAYVYNPLQYARAPHEDYLRRYAATPKRALLLGMNPGPFGMAQTGVPFGDVAMVRDWLRVRGAVGQPPQTHPKRPIEGFDCPRAEVSGTRLWGWAAARYGTPERFFQHYFVHNYCPLCFMEESGRNLTPDKLPPQVRAPLFEACDTALRGIVAALRPSVLIGVGNFAEARLRAVLPDFAGTITRIPHPSPASPAANRGWAEAATQAIEAICLD